ncbi:glycerol-3-phosphate 1-O-acyltransferase PlsY [Candidatus Poribacteria bacterium]
MVLTLLAIVLSYLAGAIPAGCVVGKLKGIDIRDHGSGNIGFTNALRVMGVGPGVLVLLADVGKGVAAVLAISQLGAMQSNALTPYIRELCGGFAMVGHVWTVFLKFRGGKGVATSLGIFTSLFWQGGLISLAVWIIIVAITRYVSLGSILLCISFCVACFIASGQYIWGMRVLALVVTVIVIYRHKGNIHRLIRGEERKFGQREKSGA